MDKREILYKKILNRVELNRMLAFWRYKDQAIVMAYGTFDMIKPGMVDMLLRAANKGNALLVAIRSDEFAKKQMGVGSPAFNQFNRAYALASLLTVSGVYIVDEVEVSDLIETVKPLAIAHSAHAADEEKAIFQKVKQWGGEIIEVYTSLSVEEPIITNEIKKD